MVVAGTGDALSMRIPNWLCVVIAALFLPMALWAGLSVLVIGVHATTGMVVLVIGYILFHFRLFGGGDAKLLAAASLWFGYPQLFVFLVFTALAGGVLALAVACWSAIRWEADIRGVGERAVFQNVSPKLPYAYAIAAGAILASPSAWWMAGAIN